ncbi:hypothetical protein [Desulfosoma sp.]|uniref:hypothetical protein n=1 Tax=Desulfosoma sp. TaxID=2603217 RepID=UPI0040492E16
MRALDHALFMLEHTPTLIDVVHFSKRLSKKIICEGREPSAEMNRWVADQSMDVQHNYAQVLDMIRHSAVEAHRLRLVAAPHSGKAAADILKYCAQQHAGIVVLGHGGSEGTWGFLKSSVTKQILADFRHQAFGSISKNHPRLFLRAPPVAKVTFPPSALAGDGGR